MSSSDVRLPAARHRARAALWIAAAILGVVASVVHTKRVDARQSAAMDEYAEIVAGPVWELDEAAIRRLLDIIAEAHRCRSVTVEDEFGATLASTRATAPDASMWQLERDRRFQRLLRHQSVVIGRMTVDTVDSLPRAYLLIGLLAVLLAGFAHLALSIADQRRYLAAARLRDEVGRRRAIQADLATKELALERATRLEALGRLAGGVAHDFNNVLTVIMGVGGLARRKLRRGRCDTEKLLTDLDAIIESSKRASAITQQLLAFGRRHALRTEVVQLPEVLESTQDILGHLISEDIELSVETGANIPPVTADRTQLEQVILNLALNGRDAMPRGGKLAIRCRRGRTSKGEPAAVLEVRDNGEGMSEHTREHLFEPFFTTKAEGRGTGLGLSTVHGIIEQAGGEIAVDSELGSGSVFTVTLPAAHDGDARERSGDHPLPATDGARSVLVVEDEAWIREYVTQVLRDLGHRVRETDRGDEALRLAAEEPVDLLVTDVVMPSMHGTELASRLREQWPELRVLFISGYAGDQRRLGRALDDDAELLRKPFSPEELERAIARFAGGGD